MPAQGGGAATGRIATLGDLTGLTFFTKFGTRKQRQLKQNCVTFKFRQRVKAMPPRPDGGSAR